MSPKTNDPRVFISYSWSSPQHEKWVMDLGERLLKDGVDVVLDKWDLKEGQDKFEFMEKMINDKEISKVLIVSDSLYSQKANLKQGGVGTESQIISKEIYENVNQEKFIPLVIDKNGDKPCLPTFVSSRIYLDFSNENIFETSYEKLLRNIFNKPENKKPAKGSPPNYILVNKEDSKSYKCINIERQIKNSLINNKHLTTGLLQDFFDEVKKHLELERLPTSSNLRTDDLMVLKSIEDLRPVRDSIVNVISDLCKYSKKIPIEDLKDYLEQLLQFNYKPKLIKSFCDLDFDNYKFFNYEVLLYVISILIKNKKYEEASKIIYGHYFYSAHSLQDDDVRIFNEYIRTLEVDHKNRIKSNLITITGETLKGRATNPIVSFSDLMLSDCVLYFCMSLKGSLYNWYPRILIYMGYNPKPDFFTKLKSNSHFEKVKSIFAVSSPNEFKTLVKKSLERQKANPISGGWSERNFPSTETLANLDQICTVP